jgi:hypothetical protein
MESAELYNMALSLMKQYNLTYLEALETIKVLYQIDPEGWD